MGKIKAAIYFELEESSGVPGIWDAADYLETFIKHLREREEPYMKGTLAVDGKSIGQYKFEQVG